jgi:hypothetical protein
MKALIGMARKGRQDLRMRIVLAVSSPALIILATSAGSHWH